MSLLKVHGVRLTWLEHKSWGIYASTTQSTTWERHQHDSHSAKLFQNKEIRIEEKPPKKGLYSNEGLLPAGISLNTNSTPTRPQAILNHGNLATTSCWIFLWMLRKCWSRTIGQVFPLLIIWQLASTCITTLWKAHWIYLWKSSLINRWRRVASDIPQALPSPKLSQSSDYEEVRLSIIHENCTAIVNRSFCKKRLLEDNLERLKCYSRTFLLKTECCAGNDRVMHIFEASEDAPARAEPASKASPLQQQMSNPPKEQHPEPVDFETPSSSEQQRTSGQPSRRSPERGEAAGTASREDSQPQPLKSATASSGEENNFLHCGFISLAESITLRSAFLSAIFTAFMMTGCFPLISAIWISLGLSFMPWSLAIRDCFASWPEWSPCRLRCHAHECLGLLISIETADWHHWSILHAGNQSFTPKASPEQSQGGMSSDQQNADAGAISKAVDTAPGLSAWRTSSNDVPQESLGRSTEHSTSREDAEKSFTQASLTKLTVKDLRGLSKERGLPQKRLKAELVQAILSWQESQWDSSSCQTTGRRALFQVGNRIHKRFSCSDPLG